MNDLLQVAVNAHGGLERWNQLKTVKASVSITGAIWQLKGKPDVLQDISIEAELHKDSRGLRPNRGFRIGDGTTIRGAESRAFQIVPHQQSQ